MCIKSGVPQGSILGPILFLIYINDITFEIQRSLIDLYADDATLYAKHTNVQEIESTLQSDLNSVSEWCKTNNMAIHPLKSKCMLLGTNAKLNKASALNLYVDEVQIDNVTSKKLLGIVIDSSLSWNLQVDFVCKKINAKIALLKRLNYFLTDQMRQLFYKAYILPMFDYCCSVWGKNKQSHIKKITMLQKRSAKVILFKPIRTPSRELFKQLEWLNFEYRCKYQTAVLVYKSLNNLTPSYVRDIIKISNNNTYQLRSSTRKDIARIRYKTQYKKHSFAYYSGDVWNFFTRRNT